LTWSRKSNFITRDMLLQKRAIFGAPAAVFLAVLMILYWRFPDRFAYGYLWAEDAPVFMKAAYEDGAGSLLRPYQGYLHLLPRLIAFAVATIFHPEHIPFVLPIACAFFSGLAGSLIFCTALQFPGIEARSRKAFAASVALAPFLVPHGGEVFLTVTNLQWILALPLMWLLWDLFVDHNATEVSHVQVAVRGALILLLTLTGPFGLIFFPVTLLAVGLTGRRPRPRATWVILALYALAAALQAVFLFSFHSAKSPAHHFKWLVEFFRYFLLTPFLPPPVYVALSRHWALMGIPLAVAIAAVTLLASRLSRRYSTALFALGLVLWVMSVLRVNSPEVHFYWIGAGERYLYIPFVMLSWGLLIAGASATRGSVRTVAWLMCGAILLTSATRFEGDHDQRWSLKRAADGMYEITVPPGWTVSFKARP
jgi:hypothetical protein